MRNVDSDAAIKIFLEEIMGGGDCCLESINIRSNAWVDQKGAMHFSKKPMAAQVSIQSQNYAGKRISIMFGGVRSIWISGDAGTGYGGIIQDIRATFSAGEIALSAHDSSYEDASELFRIKAAEMSWEIVDKGQVEGGAAGSIKGSE